MTTFWQGLVVLAALMAINVLAGLLMLGIFKLAAWVHPAALEHVWVMAPLGILAIALAIWLAYICWRALVTAITSRQRRARARASG